jgi:Protein of unknown function (DUF1116)
MPESDKSVSSAANKQCFRTLCSGKPVLYDVRPAAEVLPMLSESRTLLHAGPPIEVGRLCGPVRGALECAIVHEKWAKSYEAAGQMLDRGEIRIEPTHHHRFVGPVAGVVSPSMWVFCVKNENYENWAYSPLNEGMGRALRFGAQGEDVLKRLDFLGEVVGPVLAQALQRSGGIDLKRILQRALEMGDECHNRHEAARLLLLAELLPHLLAADHPRTLGEVCEFVVGNYYFFVSVSMAACKAMTDAMGVVAGSSLVTVMARNGTDFGIRVAGTGDRWFTAPCQQIKGVCFDGYTEADGNPDLGDSTVIETAGLGAFAMAAAPAISRYIGGTPNELTQQTLEMFQITEGEHPDFRIPALDYRGTPTGIDVRKVVSTGITPIINTSISHRQAGIGQIGAGRTRAPLGCFEAALAALS